MISELASRQGIFPVQSELETDDFGAWAQMEHFPLQSFLEIDDFRAWAQAEHFPLQSYANWAPKGLPGQGARDLRPRSM